MLSRIQRTHFAKHAARLAVMPKKTFDMKKSLIILFIFFYAKKLALDSMEKINGHIYDTEKKRKPSIRKR
jgi:hypothetical protein